MARSLPSLMLLRRTVRFQSKKNAALAFYLLLFGLAVPVLISMMPDFFVF